MNRWCLVFLSVFNCDSGIARRVLNTEPGRMLILFHHLRVPCDGLIQTWDVFAANAGVVYVGVWRDIGTSRYYHVGSNTLNVTNSGRHVCTCVPNYI